MKKVYQNFKKNYLHYSMFLFKLNLIIPMMKTQLYLHYSMFLFKPINDKLKEIEEHIYITVCFYLNEVKNLIFVLKGYRFTLQYVSI